MIVILFTIVTLMPKDTIGSDIPGEDFAHIYVFLILSCILCFSKDTQVKYIYLILFSYGFLFEILQLIVCRIYSYLYMLHNFLHLVLNHICAFLFSLSGLNWLLHFLIRRICFNEDINPLLQKTQGFSLPQVNESLKFGFFIKSPLI